MCPPSITRIKPASTTDVHVRSVHQTEHRRVFQPIKLEDRVETNSLPTYSGTRIDLEVHVVNLRNVAHDLMPLILGSLLELFAFELFERGQETAIRRCSFLRSPPLPAAVRRAGGIWTTVTGVRTLG